MPIGTWAKRFSNQQPKRTHVFLRRDRRKREKYDWNGCKNTSSLKLTFQLSASFSLTYACFTSNQQSSNKNPFQGEQRDKSTVPETELKHRASTGEKRDSR